MIYCQWSARVHQRESTAAGAIKIDLTSHSIRPDVCTSIIFQSAMTLVSTWWERSLWEWGRESENICIKPPIEISNYLVPLNPCVPLWACTEGERPKIESRFQVLWKCMNHWERFCCFYAAVLGKVWRSRFSVHEVCIWGRAGGDAHKEWNGRNYFETLGNETIMDESVHSLCTGETLTSYIIVNLISNNAQTIVQFESNVYIISLKPSLSGSYPVTSAL